MKFCVMKAAQSNPIFDIALAFGKECGGQNVMRLQLLFASANAATTVSFQNSARPRFAVAPLTKTTLRVPVHVIGIAAAAMFFGDKRRLRAPTRSGARTRWAVTVPIFARFEARLANAATLPFDVRFWQRAVNAKQDVFPSANRSCIAPKINCRLSVRSHDYKRQCFHIC